MLFLRCVQGVGRAWIQSASQALQPVFLRHTWFHGTVIAPTSSRNCGPATACSLPAAATVVNWSDDISHRPLVLSSCPASPRGLPLPLSPSPPPQLVTTRRLWLLSVWMSSVAWSLEATVATLPPPPPCAVPPMLAATVASSPRSNYRAMKPRFSPPGLPPTASRASDKYLSTGKRVFSTRTTHGHMLALKDICSRSKTYAGVVVPTRTPHTPAATRTRLVQPAATGH